MANDNTVNTFNFNTASIRVIDIKGSPWFMARDVCNALSITNLTTALPNIDRSYVCTHRLPGVAGRAPKFLSVGGLCKLIMRSDKPAARAFQDWVTNVVLPAIRKDGGYVMGEEKVTTGEMSEDELILRAHEVLTAKVARLAAENAGLKHELSVVTMAEYVSLNHVYLSQSEKGRLSYHAKKAAAESGQEITKSSRKVTLSSGEVIDSAVNVYPRACLDAAARSTGILTPRALH